MPLTAPTPKQSRLIWWGATALALAVIVGVAVLFFWGFGKLLDLLSPVLWPLAIAAVLAYLLDPAVDWLQRHKVSRSWAIAIVFAGLTCAVAGIIASIVPQLVKETNTLAAKAPTYTAEVQQSIEKWSTRAAAAMPHQATTNAPPHIPAVSTNAAEAGNAPAGAGPSGSTVHDQIISTVNGWFARLLPAVGGWLLGLLGKFTALIDLVVALILIPIYAFYFLREKHGIQAQWTRYLPVRDSRLKEELVFIITAVNQYMIAFFRGQVIVALISGCLYTIGFLGIGLDYALLLGVLAVILVIIPFIGVMVLGILGTLLTVVQFHDILHPALVIGLFAVVQSLEIFFYAPRIMGNRVNLHPVMVLVALMAGITLLGGLLGGIFAIPLAAALRVLLFRYIWKANPEAGEPAPGRR